MARAKRLRGTTNAETNREPSAEASGTEERKVAVARALGERYALTRAQVGVLMLVALGATRGEIVQETSLSLRTVKNHLEAIFDKLEPLIPERTARAIEAWVIDQALYEAVADAERGAAE